MHFRKMTLVVVWRIGVLELRMQKNDMRSDENLDYGNDYGWRGGDGFKRYLGGTIERTW